MGGSVTDPCIMCLANALTPGALADVVGQLVRGYGVRAVIGAAESAAGLGEWTKAPTHRGSWWVYDPATGDVGVVEVKELGEGLTTSMGSDLRGSPALLWRLATIPTLPTPLTEEKA